MKKTFNMMMVAVLAMLMSMTLVACGGDSVEEEKGSQKSEHAGDPTGMPRIDVSFSGDTSGWSGLVSISGDKPDGFHNPDIYEGDKKLALKLGSWEGNEFRNYSFYSPNTSMIATIITVNPLNGKIADRAVVINMKSYIGGVLVKQKSLTVEKSSVILFMSDKNGLDRITDDDGYRAY